MVDLFENQRTAVSAVAIRTHQCDRGLLSRMTWTEPKAAQAVQSTAYIIQANSFAYTHNYVQANKHNRRAYTNKHE